MLLATYILNLAALLFMFGGQFTTVAAMHACLAALLWLAIARARGSQVVRSPMFWVWMGFLALNLAQIINHGRVIPMDGGVLGLQLPRLCWLPFSLCPDVSATRLVAWAAIAGLCVAGQAPEIRARKDDIISFLLAAAVLLAGLGIWQFYAGSPGFYGRMIIADQLFFATFSYVNNAATFFMLCAALALARGGWSALLAPLFVFCIYLVECRAMLGASLLLGAYWLWVMARAPMPLFSFLVGCVAVLCWRIPELLDTRWHEYVINARLIERFPLFGCGALGGVLLAHSVAGEHIAALLQAQANTHNDYLGWMVEYGGIGFMLLAAIAIMLIRNFARRTASEFSGVSSVVVLGASMAAAHAMIDMPLRSFAVLAVLVMILTPTRSLA